MADFRFKRITQSDYRGGGTKGLRDASSGKLDLDLQSLDVTASLKPECRRFIADKSELLLKALLPEHKQNEVRNSNFLDDIYSKLGL